MTRSTSRRFNFLAALAGAALATAIGPALAQGVVEDRTWTEFTVPSDVVADMDVTKDGRQVYAVRGCSPKLNYRVEAMKGRPGVTSGLLADEAPVFGYQLRPKDLPASVRLLEYEFRSDSTKSAIHRFAPARAGTQLLTGTQLVQALDAHFPGFAHPCPTRSFDAALIAKLKQAAGALAGEEISATETVKPMASEAEARMAFTKATAAMALVSPPRSVTGSRQVLESGPRYATTWSWPLTKDDDLEVELKWEQGAWVLRFGMSEL